MLLFLSNSIFLNFILSVIYLILLIILYFQYSFTYWKKRNVPTLSPTLPFGNSAPSCQLKVTFGEHTRDLYNKLKKFGKPCGGFYIFAKPWLLILDPELAKHVLSKDFAHFNDRQLYCNDDGEPLSIGLIALNGDKWRRLRTKLTPTFSAAKIKMMFHTIATCGDQLELQISKISDLQEPIEIKDLMGRFSTDVIASCAFGLETNSLDDPSNAFRSIGKRIFDITIMEALKLAIANDFPNFYKKLGLPILPKYVYDFLTKIVKDTIEYREENNYKRKDFLQLLIQLKNKGSVDAPDPQDTEPNLTMKEVVAQCILFFAAGFETSSTATSFFMYDIATHQDIQDKVRAEINEVLAKHEGKITYESISEMIYLEKVIYESMRLHSGTPNIIRKCTKDYRIPDTNMTIEKGTAIVVPVYGLHTDPEYYPDPEKFDPERFSKEGLNKRHPYTFLPFGEGPRNCIGLRFGMLQVKVGLVSMLKNHGYTLNSKTELPIKLDPRNNLPTVLGGIWIDAYKI